MALAEQGLGADVHLWPEGELMPQLAQWDQRPVARLRLQGSASPDPLFAQVLRRHTPKSDFDTSRPVPGEMLGQLLATVPGSGLQVGGTTQEPLLGELRRLCWESAQVELLTPRTVMESVKLTRVGPAEILQHRDGISINSAVPRVAAALGMFDRGAPPKEGSTAYRQMMSRFEGHSRTAMGFIWLVTPGNSRTEQVNAGRAYVRLQLMATQLGLGMHPMSQALQKFPEMAPHYERAHRLLAHTAAPSSASQTTVQMLCRLGFTSQPAPATPRRKLQDFLLA